MMDEVVEHLVGGSRLDSKVLEDSLLSRGSDNIDSNRALLAEPPGTTHRLIPLLETMAREVGMVSAMLPVQTEGSDLRLGNQDATFAIREGR